MHKHANPMPEGPFAITRRTVLTSASLFALTSPALLRAVAPRVRRMVEPVAARHVTLKPSPFADAIRANRLYLLSLDPERLLHNFYISAGLPAPKPRYGGWESASIAGHTLGHWMSACALIIANSGDPEIGAALDHALAELARIQKAEGDGYFGGTTAERHGREVPGKVIFEEVRRGDIRVDWTLNGGWVPIYTMHKIFAGLIDAHVLAGRTQALPVVLGLAGYFAGILDGLSDAQVQTILSVEHGGILESYAELHALTGDERWREVAGRLQHHAVVDPLIAGRDVLAGLHANTQIPKLIGMARLYEATGEEDCATAARFFHGTVVNHHSYTIGGNSEREHFGQPDRQGEQLTTATCEACNSYNMLKLTRHLYSWAPSAALFDFYERTQLNHIMAHQRPDDGRFVYFMPLEAGAKRDYSTPEDSFWCCVGSGMESHAKHADSIYWQDAATLYVNLFIPSTLDWPERKLSLDLDTRYPDGDTVTLTVGRAPRAATAIAIRRPGWATDATLTLNDGAAGAQERDGYWIVQRRWRAGDRLTLTLPMRLRAEPLSGAPSTIAYLSGPLVLAADLAPAADRFDGPAPALLVTGSAESVPQPMAGAPHRYRVTDVLGAAHEMKPFAPLYDRRAAVYFRTFTPDAWASERDAYLAAETARADLARRTIDIFHIGEMQPEREHALVATAGAPGEFYGKKNRSVPEGTSIAFTLARRPGPATLQITYWGRDIDRELVITADGTEIAVERRPGPAESEWVTVDYPLTPTVATTSRFSIGSRKGSANIYGVRVIENPG